MRERRKSSLLQIHRSQYINGFTQQKSPKLQMGRVGNSQRRRNSQFSFDSSHDRLKVRNIKLRSSVAESIVSSIRGSLRSSFSSFDGDEKQFPSHETRRLSSHTSRASEVTIETIKRDAFERRRSSLSNRVLRHFISFKVRPRYGRLVIGVMFFFLVLLIAGLKVISGDGDGRIDLTMQSDENRFVNLTSTAPSQSPTIVPLKTFKTSSPSIIPSFVPTERIASSSRPSVSFSEEPSKKPSWEPTMGSINPSLSPSESISGIASLAPSQSVSDAPSQFPSSIPSSKRSEEPTVSYSVTPTVDWTEVSLLVPTQNPTRSSGVTLSAEPSNIPSEADTEVTIKPSYVSTDSPTIAPTHFATSSFIDNSSSPSSVPSIFPSNHGSEMPTSKDCSSNSARRMFWEQVARHTSDINGELQFSVSQENTVKWLSTDDNFIDICNDPFDAAIERYVLALFYFSNDGFMGSVYHSNIIAPNSKHCSTQAITFEKWEIKCDLDGYITELKIYNLLDVSATIPHEITKLNRLEVFIFRDSPELIGTLPMGFFGNPSLRDIDIMNTAISGDLFRPDLLDETAMQRIRVLRMGSDVSSLTEMFPYNDKRLYGEPSENDFYPSFPGLNHKLNDWSAGTIPQNITMMSNLVELSLSNCNLDGEIPNLDGMANLRKISLWGNRLVGTIPQMTLEVTEIKLNVNKLSGTIPTYIEQMANLMVLEIGNNYITGSIPSQIGQTNLHSLHLYKNNLTGNLPSSIGNLQNLEMLFLQNNQLSGVILPSIVTIPRLWLNLNHNLLSGTIPPFHETDMQMFQVGFNQLSGTIPITLTSLNPKITYIHLNDNNLIGTLPSQNGLTFLKELFVQGNSLTGLIPNVGDWTLQRQKYHSNEFSAVESSICQYSPFEDFTTDCHLNCNCCTVCYGEAFIATASPSTVPSSKPTPRPTPRPSPRPTPKPTPLPTPRPSPRPTPKPTPLPTPRPSPRPTPKPTPLPTPRPSPRPTPKPKKTKS